MTFPNPMKTVIIAFLLIFVAPLAMAGESVVLVTNEYPPYVDTSSNAPGIIAEIVAAAFSEAGVEAKIEFRPWRRCAMLVEDGQVFGAFPYAVTDKRKKYAMFSDPVWTCRNVFFFLKEKMRGHDFTTLEAIRGLVIAGTSGNYYEDIFKETGLTVDYAPGEASGVWKIRERRAELFAEDEAAGWTLINRIFPDERRKFGSTPTAWNVNQVRIMASKRYPGAAELLGRFNAGLRALHANGMYERIVRKYLQDAPVLSR